MIFGGIYIKNVKLFLRVSCCIFALILCGVILAACDFGGDSGSYAHYSFDITINSDGNIIAEYDDGKTIDFGNLEEQLYQFDELSDGSYAVRLDNSLLYGEDGKVIEQDGESYTLDSETMAQFITEINFPETHNGKPVTAIHKEKHPEIQIQTHTAPSQFQKVTKLTMPETVTEIADGAFYFFMSVEEIKLHEGLETIGKDAFANCEALKAVTLPSTLTTLEEGAFANCKSIEEFIIPDTVEYIREGVVNGCSSLKYLKMSIPDTDSLTNGSYHWFGGFAGGCSDDLTLEVTGGKLTSCQIGGNDSLKKVIVTKAEIIESITFNDCPNLEEIEIGKDVERIQDVMDFECPNIKKVTFRAPVAMSSMGAVGPKEGYDGDFKVYFDGTKQEFLNWAGDKFWTHTIVCSDGTIDQSSR